MANTAQARKRARQSVKVNAHNAALRSTLRTAIKKIIKAVESGDKAAAAASYNENIAIIDRIADKKIIHKNKASRHKSRLSAAIKSMTGDSVAGIKVVKAAPKTKGSVKAKPALKAVEPKAAAAKKPASAKKAKAE